MARAFFHLTLHKDFIQYGGAYYKQGAFALAAERFYVLMRYRKIKNA